jgi:hypothetical protein
VRFYGKPDKRKRKSLGDRMLEGAKRRSTVRTERDVPWLGKVLAFTLAGAVVGEVVGAIIARAAGHHGAAVSAGCAAGALMGSFPGEGNALEGLLALVLGGVFAFGDYFVLGWGGVASHGLEPLSVLGLGGVFLGVVIGRLVSAGRPAREETPKEDD